MRDGTDSQVVAAVLTDLLLLHLGENQVSLVRSSKALTSPGEDPEVDRYKIIDLYELQPIDREAK